MKIPLLYVDNEALNLELFKYSFEDKYEVVLASSGQEGLDILRKRDDINVIVSDIRMPGMDGLEFIRKIKEKTPQKKCIILSAYRESFFIDISQVKKDIYCYLNKPLPLKEVGKKINDALRTYYLLEEA